MQKIFKNISTNPVTFIGSLLLPNEQYEANYNEFFIIANDSHIKFLVSEHILVVNNGESDLNIEDGLNYLKLFQKDEAKNVLFKNSNNALKSTDVQGAIEELISGGGNKQKHYWQVHKTHNGNVSMSNASWFDAYGGRTPTGNHSGFRSNCQPLIIPFNCKLNSLQIIFREARYDWLASKGDIYIDIVFYKLVYNGHEKFAIYPITLQGTFDRSTTYQGTFKYIITDVQEINNKTFTIGDVLGVQFRREQSKAGQIYTLYDPILTFEFEEI